MRWAKCGVPDWLLDSKYSKSLCQSSIEIYKKVDHISWHRHFKVKEIKNKFFLLYFTVPKLLYFIWCIIKKKYAERSNCR